MKRLALVAFLCALCVGAMAVSAQTETPQADPCMAKGGTTSADGKCMLTMDLKISVDYPIDLAQNPLIASTIDPFIQSAKDDFMQAVGQDFYPIQAPNELDITYAVTNHSDTIMSLVFTVYEYTGGAHGTTSVTTFTFDTTNNRLITLDNVFSNTTNALNIIKPLAQAAVKAAVGDMNQQDMLDEGTAADPKNYQAFSLDADSITFYFQQYQVAPGAAGIQKVTIPFAQLSSVLDPSMTAK